MSKRAIRNSWPNIYSRYSSIDRSCSSTTIFRTVQSRLSASEASARAAISLCFLLMGAEPLFLQVKEARRSVLESPRGKSRYTHQGLRVVQGQRVMQGASDIFLGWALTKNYDYYLRQFRDMKVSAEIETFRPSTLVGYAELCGWALARAHAKAGDAAKIAGYLGATDQFDNALAKYSERMRTRRNATTQPLRPPLVPGAFQPTPKRALDWSSCCSSSAT